MEDAGRVHAREERLGGGLVGGDDGLRVVRAVAVHVLHGLVERLHELDGQGRPAVLRPPVFLRGGREIEGRRQSSRLRAGADLHARLEEPAQQRDEEARRRVAVDEKRLGGVARRRVLQLAVEDDRRRHRFVRRAIHIDVADALRVAENRDARVRLDVPDEVVPAPRDDEVDVLVEREERVHIAPACHRGERAFGDLGEGSESFCEDVEKRRRGAGGLAPALEDRRVARLERQRADLRHRVGTRLEDDEENAQRTGHLLQDEAVVEERAREDAAGRVGERGDGADAGGHAVYLGLVELQAFEGRRRERNFFEGGAGGVHIRPVRLEDDVSRRVDPVGHLSKDLVSSSRKEATARRRAATRAATATRPGLLFTFQEIPFFSRRHRSLFSGGGTKRCRPLRPRRAGRGLRASGRSR